MDTLLATALLPHQRRVFVVDITDGDKVVEEIFDIRHPWSRFVLAETVIRNPKQPRKLFDESELELLAGSLKDTLQVSPITAVIYETPDNPKILWMINDGERRLRAIIINGQAYLWIAYNPLITAENLFQASAIANLCRKGHTYMENAWVIAHLLELNNTDDFEVIAKQMGFTKTWVEQLHSLTRLHPTLQILIDPPTKKKQRIPIDAALGLASVSQQEQLNVWEEIKDVPKGQMSVMVRSLTGAVKSGTGRPHRPSDDARIAKGKFRSIRKKIQEALSLPDSIFQKIPVQNRPELRTTVEEIRTLLKQLEEKLGTESEMVLDPEAETIQMVKQSEPPKRREKELDAVKQEEPAVEKEPTSTEETDNERDVLKILQPKPAVIRQTSKKPRREPSPSLTKLACARLVRPRPLPPGPDQIRPFKNEPPARGTPVELPEAEIHEDPEIELAAARERIQAERRRIESTPARLVSVGAVGPSRGLAASDIIANIVREKEEARRRIAQHQQVKLPRNSLTGLSEGQGFTNRDFRELDS